MVKRIRKIFFKILCYNFGERIHRLKESEIAVNLLDTLKAEKLRIDRWRESGQLKAQVKTLIYDSLQWLLQSVYTDPDVHSKFMSVYQHIYSNYPGGNQQAAFGR